MGEVGLRQPHPTHPGGGWVRQAGKSAKRSVEVRGRAAVGAYWARALQLYPDLHFELITVLAGIGSVTLYYRGTGGRLAAEVLHFAETGRVARASVSYEI